MGLRRATATDRRKRLASQFEDLPPDLLSSQPKRSLPRAIGLDRQDGQEERWQLAEPGARAPQDVVPKSTIAATARAKEAALPTIRSTGRAVAGPQPEATVKQAPQVPAPATPAEDAPDGWLEFHRRKEEERAAALERKAATKNRRKAHALTESNPEAEEEDGAAEAEAEAAEAASGDHGGPGSPETCAAGSRRRKAPTSSLLAAPDLPQLPPRPGSVREPLVLWESDGSQLEREDSDSSGWSAVTHARVAVPPRINQHLRDYQRDGVLTIAQALRQDHGIILGDEMGLGKAVQVRVELGRGNSACPPHRQWSPTARG